MNEARTRMRGYLGRLFGAEGEVEFKKFVRRRSMRAEQAEAEDADARPDRCTPRPMHAEWWVNGQPVPSGRLALFVPARAIQAREVDEPTSVWGGDGAAVFSLGSVSSQGGGRRVAQRRRTRRR
jgi:hypothetical protein